MTGLGIWGSIKIKRIRHLSSHFFLTKAASFLHRLDELLLHLGCKFVIRQNVQANQSIGLARSQSFCMRVFGSCSFAKQNGMWCILGSYIKDCLDAWADVAAGPKVTRQRQVFLYQLMANSSADCRGTQHPASKENKTHDDTYELPACGNVANASAVDIIVFGVIPRCWIMYCRYCSASVSFVTMSS